MIQSQAYTECNGTVCVVGSAVIGSVIGKPMWDKWSRTIGLVQRGGNGRSSLIAYDRLPEKWRMAIEQHYGSPYSTTPGHLRDWVKEGADAAAFFSTYDMSVEKQAAYTASARVMNALTAAYETERTARAAHGKRMGDFWSRAIKGVMEVKPELGHNINVKNARALQRKWEKYYKALKTGREEAYATLVHKLHGKRNALKVAYPIERLLLSIYCMPNRPFAKSVHADFEAFMAGKLQVCDLDTGELLDPAKFTNADGTPLTMTEQTVWNHLNKPHNRAIVDRMRMGWKRYNDVHRPHMDRKSPEFSFSKITLDDRDLPRLMHNNKRVKAYYAYDVASGAVIGKAYSRTKDHDLFIECLRDMFRTMYRNGWGMPMEIEVEHHLVKEYRRELEELFPHVRFCATSQEKRAEHFNRTKKYGVEKTYQRQVGRWWARSEAYQTDEDVVNGEFVGQRYDYEELVTDDMMAIDLYNEGEHRQPKRFPNMSRWDVLEQCMNPNLAELNLPVLMKMIGHKTTTTIRRNSKFQVNHKLYELPSTDVLIRLAVNNYTVEAYWLPDDDGQVRQVHVYQGDKFIATCKRRERYQEARAERSSEDWNTFNHQRAQAKEFDEFVKRGTDDLMKLEVIRSNVRPEETPTEVVPAPRPEHDDDYLTTDLLDGNEEQIRNNAIDSL